jgi:hypothetical protein
VADSSSPGRPHRRARLPTAGGTVSGGPATLILGARRLLAGLMVLTALIQIIDGVVDSAGGRLTLVPGVLALGVAFLVGAARLSPRPLWQSGVWDDTAPREPAPGAAASAEAEEAEADEPTPGGMA